MKYLNKREDFLRNTKLNEGSSDLIRSSKPSGLKPYTSINEDAGPFYNEVGWSESLLGRLMSHIIRKAKIALDMVRIKPVIKRLYSEMDRISAEGVILSTDGMEESIARYKLSEIYGALTKSIEEEEEISSIKGLTIESISLTKSLEVESKDILLEELEGLKKFLDEVETDKTDEDETGEVVNQSSYGYMIKNLTSLSNIISNYKTIRTKKEEYNTIDKYTYTTKEGDTVRKIQINTVSNPKKLDISSIRSKNDKSLKSYPGDDDMLKIGLELIMESKFGTGGSTDRNVIRSGEDNLTQALKNLNISINSLIDIKDKGVGLNFENISELIKNKMDPETKKSIISLYSDVKSYLVGKNSKTIQEPSALFNEGLNVSEPKERLVIAEKIARFSKRALQFKGTGLEGGLGDLKSPLMDFISTMDFILNNEIKLEVESKVKESLLKYDKFIRLYESDESDEDNEDNDSSQNDRSVSDPESGTKSEKIKNYYNSKCKTVKEYVMDRTEAEKLKSNLDELDEKSKKGDFIIDGLDPVIQIIRLFNRAYKIFTVKTISNRVSGKVAASVSNDYTSYSGGDSLTGVNGPYRNNKLFNMWEDAVLKILGDPKYQYIFNSNTKLRIADVPNPKNKEDYRYVEKGGSILRTFMTDILDGEELYKISGSSSNKGVQEKFLTKYFGDVSLEGQPDLTMTPLEGKENSDNATLIDNNAIKLEFKKVSNNSITEKQYFVIDYKTINDKGELSDIKKRYFYINDYLKSNGEYNLSYCGSFYFFYKYITNSPNKEASDGRKKTVTKGSLDSLENSNTYRVKDDNTLKPYNMKYTRIKNIKGLITPNQKMNFKSIKNDRRDIEDENIQVINSYWLCMKDIPWTMIYDVDKFNKMFTFGDSNKISDVKTHLGSSSSDIKITQI